MQLTVSGLDTAELKFKHLWGRYILGFKPQKHCIQCFKTKIARDITPSMRDGTCDLRDDLADFFYLCGVGQPDSKRTEEHLRRKFTNVHLAVRPRAGCVATITSVYGVTFTIRDAEAIAIQSLPDDFQGLPKHHARCKNFQFGFQEFAVGSVRDVGPDEIVYQRRTFTARSQSS